MSTRYNTWKEAHTAAIKLARLLGRETGILGTKEFGKEGFNVYSLPQAKNRCGADLRCEIVSPGDPI
jgi:hypothetical protein